MLAAKEDLDPKNNAKLYTTISRLVDGYLDSLAIIRIPRLNGLGIGYKKEVECLFCFWINKFKNKKV